MDYPYAAQLRRVEAALDAVLAAEHVDEAARAFVRGGKRLRARLLLASAGGHPFLVGSSDLIQAAVVIELVHAGSLLHDDIVDRCDVRRGSPALHEQIGVRSAAFHGTHLIQLALRIAGDLPRAVRRGIGIAARELSHGQFRETTCVYDRTLATADRLRIVRQKTASIFGLSCELGSLLTAETDEGCLRRRRFGEALGVLFQIADDVDDLFASEDELGRQTGADLRGGVLSTPLTCALETASRERVAALLTAAWADASVSPLPKLQRLLIESGAVERTHRVAQRYAEDAETQLVLLPETSGSAWLATLVAQTLSRCERWVHSTPAGYDTV